MQTVKAARLQVLEEEITERAVGVARRKQQNGIPMSPKQKGKRKETMIGKQNTKLAPMLLPL